MTVDSVLINAVRQNHLRVNDVVQVPHRCDAAGTGHFVSSFYNGTPFFGLF